ncbi:MAG: hypothetical protein RLZZ599_1208 [Bacteroidota bacterium]|jgi:cell division septal protein FtsQ
MKKKRILKGIGLILVGTALILAYAYGQTAQEMCTYEKAEITIQSPLNQLLVEQSEVEKVVHQALLAQEDSNGLKINTFLLETSLNSLPYVRNAQVYWNLNNTIAVQVSALQAKAKVFIGSTKYLLTTDNQLLPAPKKVQVDVPILTGIEDSAAAIEAGSWLDMAIASPAFDQNTISQIHINGDHLLISPTGCTHDVVANADERLANDLTKLSAFYAAKSNEELNNIQRLDVRFKNQVVQTAR